MKSNSFSRHFVTKGIPILIFSSFILVSISELIELKSSPVNLFYWPVTPILITLIISKFLSDRDSWTLNDSILSKGKDKTVLINTRDIEWFMIGKPKTRQDEFRYKFTKGSQKYKFSEIIDNMLCIKTNDKEYLKLNIYFHKNGKKITETLKKNMDSCLVKESNLTDSERNLFKIGNENKILRL